MAQKTDLDLVPLLRFLVYGRPGAGKTWFAGSAALDERTAPVLYLDAAGNPESLRGFAQRPDVIRVEELRDLNDPYRWIAGGQKPDVPFAQRFKLNPPYRTLVIDHVTDVQRMSFNVVQSTDSLLPGDLGPKADWDAHGQVLRQMLRFAKLYFTLPLHVIMTAHEKNIYKDNELVYIEPMISGQSASALPGYALAVGRMINGLDALREDVAALKELNVNRQDLKEGSPVMFFGPTARFAGKDQYNAFGRYLTNPTVTLVMDLIEKEPNK